MPIFKFSRSTVSHIIGQVLGIAASHKADASAAANAVDLLGHGLLDSHKTNLHFGSANKDVFFGGRGNDLIIGRGHATNTAVYSHSLDHYKITTTKHGITVKSLDGNEGTDLLKNVTQLTFAGVTYKVQPTHNGTPPILTLVTANQPDGNPIPTDPTPPVTDPAPTDPNPPVATAPNPPSDPVPSDPTPPVSNPAPTDPNPPVSTTPNPPSDPVPSDPTPPVTDPAPTDPTPPVSTTPDASATPSLTPIEAYLKSLNPAIFTSPGFNSEAFDLFLRRFGFQWDGETFSRIPDSSSTPPTDSTPPTSNAPPPVTDPAPTDSNPPVSTTPDSPPVTDPGPTDSTPPVSDPNPTDSTPPVSTTPDSPPSSDSGPSDPTPPVSTTPDSPPPNDSASSDTAPTDSTPPITDPPPSDSTPPVSTTPDSPPVTDPAPSDPTPPVSPPDSGSLPGFTLQNTSGAAEGSGYVSFGQMFAKGAVMPGQSLTAHIGGQDVAVQMDVKTTNDDGSVGHAILTLIAPALAAGASVGGTLATGGSSTGPAIQAQDILAHGYDFKAQLTLHNADGSTTVKTVDAAQLLQQAIDSGHVESWMQGAQASEYRVTANVAPNLDVKFDIRLDAAGQTHTDVIFARDDAYTTDVATLTYDVTFTQGGQTVFSDANIQQYAYSTWHQAVASPGAVDPHVVYDTAYLIATGAIPAYDLSTPVSAAAIADQTQRLAEADTGPLGNALVQQYMPGTGGRPDIGPETTWTARYLASQSADAAKVMYANADAAGSVPWHLVGTQGEVLRVDEHPYLWTDGRANSQWLAKYGDVMPVSYDPHPSGWAPDIAHKPSLSFVPYILSGSHYYLDELQAQAAYVLTSMNPSYREFGTGLVSDHNQIRAIAWGLRDLANAAFITPDADALKGYFSTVLSNNLDHYITEYVNGAKGDAQGQLEGWIQYGNATRTSPWQQDFVATTMALIAGRGDEKAATILDWMDNFIAGRFINEANGYDPLHGATYHLETVNPVTGQPYATWAEAYQASFGSAPATGMDPSAYPSWAGGYGATVKAALAGIISTTQSPDAIEAYGWLQSQTTAMLESYQTDPTWNIAPKLANGQYLTNDEIHVHSATAGATLTAGAGEQMLIGNIGADTIVGGSGIGLLFGMDGNDTLEAGSGNSYLFGGNGNDRLVDGAGGNYFKGGTGADVFAFTTSSTGRDTIADFTKGADRIEIKSNLDGSGIFSGADVVSHATADASGQAVLHLGGSHDIVLQGVMLHQLTSDIFTIV